MMVAELPEWEGTHQDIMESYSCPCTGHPDTPTLGLSVAQMLLELWGSRCRQGGGQEAEGQDGTRTCFWVTLRTSPTYMILPWCLTMPTVMESSHTSEAMYLSTWMPRSFSTSRPAGARGVGHVHAQRAPSPVPTCPTSLPRSPLVGTPGVGKTMCPLCRLLPPQ